MLWKLSYLCLLSIILAINITTAADNLNNTFDKEILDFVKNKSYYIEKVINSTIEGDIKMKMFQIKKISNSLITTSTQESSDSSLVILEINGTKKYFIAELKQIGDVKILNMYNDEENVQLDISNKEVLNSLDSNNCVFLTCLAHYVVKQLKDPIFLVRCGSSCIVDPTGFSCLWCLISKGVIGINDCSINKCRWYPCQKNCDSLNNYGEPNFFCSGDDLLGKIYYSDYMCPNQIAKGQIGECILDNVKSGYVNELKERCSNTCTTNACMGLTYPDFKLLHGEWRFLDLVGWRWFEEPANLSRRPILLIHGWSNDATLKDSNSNEWGDLQTTLKSLGLEVWRLEYAPANLSSKKNAGMVAKAMKELLNKGYENNFDKIDVIAHSNGGLAVRGYIEELGVDEKGQMVPYKNNIRKLILMASPTGGTYLANLVDGTTNLDIKSHPLCYNNIVVSQKRGGGTEATNDMQIGSDFTWELNNKEINRNIDYLTISGIRTLDKEKSLSYSYCLSNKKEINDGIVSIQNSNLIGKGYPMISLDKFHSSIKFPIFGIDGIDVSSKAAQLSNLFLNDKLNFTTVKPFLSKNEIYYNSGGEGGFLYNELANKGSLILELQSSENLINDNSIILSNGSNNYALTANKKTKRFFYIDLESDSNNKRLNYNTMIPKGTYDIIINGFNSNKKALIQFGRVNLIKDTLDEDIDNYDTNKVGGGDCDDSDENEFPGQKWYSDIDNDGFAGNIKEQCERLQNYKLQSDLVSIIPDCDDNNNLINSNAIEICDKIDNNCNNLIDEGDVCPKFTLNVLSPTDIITRERLIQFNITSSEISNIYYIDYSDARSKWQVLCKNCQEYGDKRKTTKSFTEGWHNITFRAINGTSIAEENIYFFIDSKDPSILKTELRSTKFTNGTFKIEFREDNPKNLILFYGNDNIINKSLNISKECYFDRNNYKCIVNANLSNLNNKTIYYWFNITDIASNSDSSRIITKVKVDTISPVINSFIKNMGLFRRVTFKINVTELNFDKITYIDSNDVRQIERTLCHSLRNSVCSVAKSFSSGAHNLTITVLDNAGNSARISTKITII